MTKEEGDYIYDVWRYGGNPDAVDLDDVPQDYDWVWVLAPFWISAAFGIGFLFIILLAILMAVILKN